ncbi:RluA family pseudouridine synthase [Desulfomonile tiedjei]|uniref:Pseudouridine synthase n=1 Tax=Desulfomonile tiedjei (strain ATCC 49306 / DSM 6799 / DCB-1) TaxID=706587 RepID=I4CAD4_DESTA|nr:RluA family pseudouridine synthase [Desulfomonile tiedjei]AFM26525.1 ribosomal large subunit pseudouridine synthase D [Desulfomonile tiedjei DSM 6799]
MPESVKLIIPTDAPSDRADKVLAVCLKGTHSRSALAKLIRLGLVRVHGTAVKPSTVLNPGDCVELLAEEISPSPAISGIPDFSILFEDSHIIVVNKPPGLVVHPGAGRPGNTLMDALVADRPQMLQVGEEGRWGVVHRLDRDTSGVMVLAKTSLAHESLSAQFRAHSVHRIYLALVRGNPGQDSGRIEVAIGRHPKDRKRISTVTTKARHAATKWRVLTRLGPLTLLEVMPETGRTHQIRVHLASIGLPVAGDPVYGKIRKKGGIDDPKLKAALRTLHRQALHAAVLGLKHPEDKQYVEFSSPLPDDIQAILDLQFSHEECPG